MMNKIVEISIILNKMVQSVKNGSSSALPLLVDLKAISKEISAYVKLIEEDAVREIELHPKGIAEIQDCEVRIKSRTNYKYDHCIAYQEQSEKIKALQKLMKTITEPIVLEETGELIEPATTTTTNFIEVKQK